MASLAVIPQTEAQQMPSTEQLAFALGIVADGNRKRMAATVSDWISFSVVQR